VSKIAFILPESKLVWQHLETVALRSHQDPSRAFDDLLGMTICALSGGQMENEYLSIVRQYDHGEKGRRAIDAFPEALADLIVAMEHTRKDILGDIFQGAVSYGRNGQFFTPDTVCELMARLSMGRGAERVLDPCCGSGRLLLAAADVNPQAEFYGQDIDLRCVQMTTINLALRNLRGQVVLGDSLSNERRLVYHTGFNGRGFIAEVSPEQCPEPVKRILSEVRAEVRAVGAQLTLF
jgi:ribosomal protein L11 methylase PrmA